MVETWNKNKNCSGNINSICIDAILLLEVFTTIVIVDFQLVGSLECFVPEEQDIQHSK